MAQAKKHKITWLTRIGYGAGGLVNNGGLSFAAAYLSIFVITHAGLSPVEAAFITSVALVVDTILSPIAGYISDLFYETRLGRKFGRRRFWLLLAIPLMALQPLMFLPVNFGTSSLGFWYYFTLYIIYNITYTMAVVPLNVLPQEMTTDFTERNWLTGAFTVASFIYGIVLGFLESAGFVLFGEQSSWSFTVIAVIDSVIIIVALIMSYACTWERSYDDVKRESVQNLFEMVKKLVIDLFSYFQIRSASIVFFMKFFAYMAAKLNSVAIIYYTVYACGLPKSLKGLMNTIAQVLLVFITSLVLAQVQKRGYKKIWIAGEIGVIIGFVGWFVTGAFHDMLGFTTTALLYAAVFLFFNSATAGLYLIPNLVGNFLPDIDELVTNRRREGEYSAIQRIADQLARAIMTMVFMSSLAAAGFVSSTSGDVAQPPSVRWTILFTLLICGVGFSIAALACSHWLKVDEQSCSVLNKEISRVKSGGNMADVDPEVQKTCESLTGVPYEICFGHNSVGYKTPKEHRELKIWQKKHPLCRRKLNESVTAN